MSREKTLVKNTFIIAFGTFLPKLSGIITLPIITAGLTKEEFGTYDLINTLVSFLLPVVTLQIQSSAFRFLIDFRGNLRETKRIITNIIGFILPTSFIALTILYFSLFRLAGSTRILICIYFFVDILKLAVQQIVRGLSKNKLYSLSSIIQSLINLALTLLMIYLAGMGLIGLLLSISLATSVGLIILIVWSGIIGYVDFSLLSKETLKEMLNYSWPMIPNTLSLWILNLSDRLVLTIFLGVEATAIYAVANKIPSLFSTVQGTFVFAWQENASVASRDSDAAFYYSSMFDHILCILAGIMAVLIGITPLLFSQLIRGDYKNAYLQMPILFFGMLYSAISAFMGGIYVAHKKTKNLGIATLMAAVINLLIDLLLVNRIDVYAASVSTLVSYFCLAVYRMINIQKIQEIKYNFSRFIGLNLVLLLMCGFFIMQNNLINIVNAILGFLFALALNRNVLMVMVKGFTSKIKK